MTLDKILYRLFTGSWEGFRFQSGPNPDWSIGTDIEKMELGLYIHIPFCHSLCPFCPYTKVLYSAELAENYLRALTKETHKIIEAIAGKKITSVYFGGGTPLTLPAAIEKVLSLIEPCLEPGAGIGIELHPRDVTPSNLRFLKSINNVMVSLGVESLQDHTLKYLGRGYGSNVALEAIKAVIDQCFHLLNVDLMTCIPGQSKEEVMKDMLRLLETGVDQVSAYPLMDFSFTHQKSSHSLWEQWQVLNALSQTAQKEGYDRSSVWTWTKQERPKYTSITRQRFIGIGAGAATHLDNYFAVNTFNVPQYINHVLEEKSPVALHTLLTPRENALYWLFWRCYEGAIDSSAPEVAHIRGFKTLVSLLRPFGLTQCDGIIRLNEKALFLYHILERYYTRRYIGKLWAVCRENPFPSDIVL